MKWVVAVIAVLSAFLVGFGLGWKLHRPEQVVRTVEVPSPPPIATAVPVPTPTQTITAPPPESSRPFAWPKSGAPSHGVTRLDATHYEVDRRYLDDILADSSLTKSLRIVPEQVDGGVAGLRVFGVRPSTVAANLGLQNGDRLDSINGYSLASPDKALEAYTKIRRASEATLTLVRHGAPMTIHYRVTD